MKETGKERFIFTKAYEIAYAIFRLAAQIKETDFSERLRAGSMGLLGAAVLEDYVAAERSLRLTECLIKFGGGVNLIGAPNTDVILREVYALDVAIAERKNAAKTDEVDIAEIFSKPEVEKKENSEPAIRQTAKDEPMFLSTMNDEPTSNISGILKSAIRQTAILDRIRQSGNCRLKDIQEILPECSERTIRYDLQTLLEQNLIERVGNAGPSVFYRASQAA
jgi:DNA-binding HxlR family transcriptional regulator